MNLISALPVAALLLAPFCAGGQSLLDRSPNVSGDWVGAPGTIYFHFVHRFATSNAPERKVSNVPTFLLAAGLPMRLLAGFNYSTNSTLAPRFPNEWEAFARWAPLQEDYGAPLDLGAQVGYNNAADGVDAEVSAAKKLGIARVIVAGRALSNPLEAGNVQFAVAGGATVRLGQYLALAGDVGSLTSRDSTDRVAWSAGIHFAIPLTPHTVSLHASNTSITTLQGSSRGSSNIRYGFEFTIPLTLRRYFGKREETAIETVTLPVPAVVDSISTPRPEPQRAVAVPAAPAPPVASPRVGPAAGRASEPKVTPSPASVPRTTPHAGPAASVPKKAASAVRTVSTAIKNINYLQPKLQITVGSTVEWRNSDPLPHTVTATDRSFDSGLIQPGKTYRRTFTKAGTYNFFCMPHPFMKGTIVVKEP